MSKHSMAQSGTGIPVKGAALVSLVLALWGMYLRFARFAGRELWNDEHMQLDRTIGPFKEVWRRNVYGDMTAFPGDYLLTYPFYKIFGINKWALIFPHIISTVLGFILLYLICRIYFKTVWGFVITFLLMTLNTNLIFHAFELRPYAVLPTLSLAAFYFSYLIINGNVLKPLHRLWMGVFFVLTIWFHAYGILIAAFTVLFHLISKWIKHRTWVVLKEGVKFFAWVFAAALPLWLWYSTVFGDPHHIWPDKVFDTFHYMHNPVHDPIGFMKAIFGNLVGNKFMYVFLPMMVIAPMMRGKDQMEQISFIIVLVCMPLTVICLVDLLTPYWFLQRQFIWVMPLFAFLLGWQWDLVLRKNVQLTKS